MDSIAEREILPVLERIAWIMIENRATKMEVLAYLTSLCYQGAQGGTVAIEPGSSLDDASQTIDSLWRYFMDDEDDMSGIPFERDRVFLYAPYSPEDYIEAFHLLLKDCEEIIKPKDASVYFHDDDIYFFTGRTYSTDSFYLLLNAQQHDVKRRILDLEPSFVPQDYSFSVFERYVMVESDPVRRAFFTLRKELEGPSWKQFEVMGEIPSDETFDFIHLFQDPSTPEDIPHELEILQKHLSSREYSAIVVGVPYGFLHSKHSVSTICLQDSLQLERVFYKLPSLGIQPCLVFKRNPVRKRAVSFICLDTRKASKLSKAQYRRMLTDALSIEEGEFTTTVPFEDIREGTIDPAFYLLRRDLRTKENTVSLYDISIFDVLKAGRRSSHKVLTVPEYFENDPFLRELTPEIANLFPSERNYLIKDAIFIRCPKKTEFSPKKGLFVRQVKVDKGSTVFVSAESILFAIDTERFDPRFIVMTIQKSQFTRSQLLLFAHNSYAVLDLIRIPDIPIEEQRKAVETFFEGVRGSLPGYVKDSGSKPVTYNILVITPDRDTFEDRFGGKMEEEHLNVVGYASDSKSLSEVLPKHFGKDVPASLRVDAVLADVSAPVGDTNFVLMKIHDLDVRKFYYSTCEYSRGCIYDIFWDAVETGLVEGDEPASGMRRALDTQMSPEARLREEYREFFQSADRLDSLHPGWDLSGTVMKYLLDGRTKTPVNTVRSRLSETLCRFFRDCRAVPFCMEDGAIPSFLADGDYKDGKRNLEYKVDDKVDDKTQKSEAWVRYAFVALFKLGNKESHVSKDTEEMVSEAALIILMQVIRWFEGAHDRYAEGGIGFKCFRGDKECRLQTVREVAPGYFAVGDVHVGRQEGLRDGSVGVLNDHLPREKNPRTIDGATYTRYAGKDSFHILLQ